MATISSRVDTELKMRAEAVADSIGLSLSSVITVFLKRFVEEQGFPFAVKSFIDLTQMPTEQVTKAMQQHVADGSPVPAVPPVTYLDPHIGKLVTVQPK